MSHPMRNRTNATNGWPACNDGDHNMELCPPLWNMPNTMANYTQPHTRPDQSQRAATKFKRHRLTQTHDQKLSEASKGSQNVPREEQIWWKNDEVRRRHFGNQCHSRKPLGHPAKCPFTLSVSRLTFSIAGVSLELWKLEVEANRALRVPYSSSVIEEDILCRSRVRLSIISGDTPQNVHLLWVLDRLYFSIAVCPSVPEHPGYVRQSQIFSQSAKRIAF
jgi:hypothetical protein